MSFVFEVNGFSAFILKNTIYHFLNFIVVR